MGPFQRGFQRTQYFIWRHDHPGFSLIVGIFRGDAYARNTALLAGEAVVDEVVTSVLKNISHRLRPAAVPTNQVGTSAWFGDKSVTLGGTGSFPSGHTIAAFSVATICSHRYRHHRSVPYVSYGLAARGETKNV